MRLDYPHFVLDLASIWRNNSPNSDAGQRDNMSTMKKLLIVYQSFTGGTAQMAAAAAAGAAGVEDVATQLVTAAAAGPEMLLASDGFLFACPENLAAMAGLMKDFFDRSYYPVLEQLNGRPYATLICAGSDGSNAARQIERIATGWRLKEVAPPLIVCTHAQTPEQILSPKQIGEAHLAQCRELGATIAAGLSLGLY
jgi:multimeric flavodoxin WrbA